MIKFTIRQNLIRKSSFLLLLLGIISFGAIGGCSNNGQQSQSEVLTENDFTENAALTADSESGIVVNFLEPPDSDTPEIDTGTGGTDEFPVKYERTIAQTFCWEDEDSEAAHFMELLDSEGSQVVVVNANGGCVDAIIEEGDYKMVLHHDGRTNTSHTIFARPIAQNSELSQNGKGLINRFKLSVSSIIAQINHMVLNEAVAQSEDPDETNFNIRWLLINGSCIDCSLLGANFFNQDLNGVNLTGADLRFSNLTSTRMVGATLRDADFREATIIFSDLTGADLVRTDFRFSALFGSDLPGADLTGAKLQMTDLTNVNFTDAVLNDANFGLATWCDGSCICDENSSIGVCNGCASVEICTGEN